MEHMSAMSLAGALEHWEFVCEKDKEIMMAAPRSPIPPVKGFAKKPRQEPAFDDELEGEEWKTA